MEEEIDVVSEEVLVESMVPKAATMIIERTPARTVMLIGKFFNTLIKSYRRFTD